MLGPIEFCISQCCFSFHLDHFLVMFSSCSSLLAWIGIHYLRCRYVRILGTFYLRLTRTDVDIYCYLEPLYNDYHKLRRKLADGKFALMLVVEVIDEHLTKDYSCDIALPRIRKRWTIESIGSLEPRKSVLEDDFEEEKEENKQKYELDSGFDDRDYYNGRSAT